ncbi:hypothetical protein Tco_0113274 [Tanacetum coccineum]
MTKLTQKNVKFDWSEKAKVAFQLLKQKLCSAPIFSDRDSLISSEKGKAAFQLLKQKLCSASILVLPEGNENCKIRYHPGKANVVADALS